MVKLYFQDVYRHVNKLVYTQILTISDGMFKVATWLHQYLRP